jgi:hypothetical protein
MRAAYTMLLSRRNPVNISIFATADAWSSLTCNRHAEAVWTSPIRVFSVVPAKQMVGPIVAIDSKCGRGAVQATEK